MKPRSRGLSCSGDTGIWRAGSMCYLLRNFGAQSIASLRERLCASGDEAGGSGLLKHVGS